jgi:spore coat polysaccharide biosynthesis protein SpsF
MGSSRLPGKVMRPLAGHPVVWHVVERARRIEGVDHVVVATSRESTDDELAAYLGGEGIPVVRGSETDVLGRYVAAAHASRADVVVRVTADCPLISPKASGRVVARLLAGDCDYASNTIERTYPRGLDTSACLVGTLERADREATDASDREHVMTYVRRHPDRFRLCSVTDEVDRSHLRLTLDTAEDLELLSRIYDALWPRQPDFGYHAVLALLERHPDWIAINRDVKQKEESG